MLFFQVLLVLTTIMVGCWMAVYRDGYDWYGSNPKQQFSFHPLFMYIGLVFLYGNGKQHSLFNTHSRRVLTTERAEWVYPSPISLV